MDSVGRHGATFGRLDSTRTPGLHTGDWHAACFPARGCGLLYLLSAEGDNNQFPYKDDAHVGSKNGYYRIDKSIRKRTNQPIGSVDRWLGLKYQLSSGNRQETADVDGHPSSSELKLPPLRLFHLLRRSSWLLNSWPWRYVCCLLL